MGAEYSLLEKLLFKDAISSEDAIVLPHCPLCLALTRLKLECAYIVLYTWSYDTHQAFRGEICCHGISYLVTN